MKKFKTILTIVIMSIASMLPASINANTEPDNLQKVKTILRSKIVKLLGKHS